VSGGGGRAAHRRRRACSTRDDGRPEDDASQRVAAHVLGDYVLAYALGEAICVGPVPVPA